MTLDPKREDALELIRRNIERFGHHIYIVSQCPNPRFAYTIGLRDRLGLELIFPGAIFYLKDDVLGILNQVASELGRRMVLEPEKESFEFNSRGSFSLRNVHASWASKLILGALDYYGTSEIRTLQISPDENHRTIDVPDMSVPWNATLAPPWRWLYDPWTYRVPRQSVAATNLAAVRGERVTEAARWEEEEWEISAGPASDVPKDEMRVVPLGTLVSADESLAPIINLAVGEGIWRGIDSEWRIWEGAPGTP
jgi:hypothetical protein